MKKIKFVQICSLTKVTNGNAKVIGLFEDMDSAFIALKKMFDSDRNEMLKNEIYNSCDTRSDKDSYFASLTDTNNNTSILEVNLHQISFA